MLRDPGDREPAPQPLRAIQAFVNTVDLEHGREEIETPDDLRRLLVRLRLLSRDDLVTADDLARGLELREALRDLLLANNGLPAEAGAIAALERAAAQALLTIRFGADSPELVPRASGVDGALGRLVGIAFTSMAAGTWPRLKACRRDVCHWVFYDQSKNRSSTWCAMSVCGNRTKTRVYRHRQAHSA
jgi:predicted RNA-binding Zn ribbon-like protein